MRKRDEKAIHKEQEEVKDNDQHPKPLQTDVPVTESTIEGQLGAESAGASLSQQENNEGEHAIGTKSIEFIKALRDFVKYLHK